MTSDTSALPSGARAGEPENITSSILDDLTVFAACTPSAHIKASTTLDLPLPLGPTTTVTPGSKTSVTGSAKDLKPFMVIDFKYMIATIHEIRLCLHPYGVAHHYRHSLTSFQHFLSSCVVPTTYSSSAIPDDAPDLPDNVTLFRGSADDNPGSKVELDLSLWLLNLMTSPELESRPISLH